MSVTYALHDGRAGNARQALALAHALHPDPIELALDPRPPWRWLAPHRLPLSTHAFGNVFAKLAVAPPELAIGCGRQSALATRLLRTRSSKVVQILDPRITASHWDVVVAPEHDGVRGDNVITTLGSLHQVDDLWLAQARQAIPALAMLPSPHTVLLVGGPSRHAALGNAEFQSLLHALSTGTQTDGGSFSVVASRRTPPSWRDAIARIQGDLPGVRWRGEHDGANPYAGLLGHADRIVCTPDSVNMLSEAAATLAPVYVWSPHLIEGRTRRFIDTLIARGRIRTLHPDAVIDTFVVEPLRETARVASAVRHQLNLPD
ncbi:MAG: mitochondrial fission ELM1 family protein [Pseudomonadota bacterium]|nr:mitochondrial fission ELM1 family protein [Pseudomonadota bacterium]MDQ3159606.1 mitochondrial fission ELM1 family protein [Pseudomonadota bacterium]